MLRWFRVSELAVASFTARRSNMSSYALNVVTSSLFASNNEAAVLKFRVTIVAAPPGDTRILTNDVRIVVRL